VALATVAIRALAETAAATHIFDGWVRHNQEINAGLADPKIKARFADLGTTVIPGSPADFGKLIAEEIEKWAQRIHQHCALANQPLPTSVQQHSGLLLSRLDRHEAHRRDSLSPRRCGDGYLVLADRRA
jgi:hypothetical protein